MQKQIFTSSQSQQQDNNLERKRIFAKDADIQADPEMLNNEYLAAEAIAEKFEQIVQPKPSGWKKLVGVAAVLFSIALVAQTIQWLIDSWQQNQWIYVAFAVASLTIILVAIKAIIQEWRRLVRLKRLLHNQQKSRQLLNNESTLSAQDESEKGKAFCLEITKNMQLDPQHPTLIQWQQQISEAHSAQEVAYLFSQNVLADLDQKAQKAISQSASEAALVVAISPLALVDIFFVAWRNLRLMNKIANIYGIELGYFSRIRLLRMVLINMAFAGATELIQEMGLDWLSQDIAAKLSARVAQGMGIGLLTARLGIKTMEFCRPIAFQANEKPRLSTIHKQLLSTLKHILLNKTSTNMNELQIKSDKHHQ